MKIQWKHFESIWHKGAPVVAGGVLDLPKAQAQGFIDSGKAVSVESTQPPKTGPDPESEPVIEKESAKSAPSTDEPEIPIPVDIPTDSKNKGN